MRKRLMVALAGFVVAAALVLFAFVYRGAVSGGTDRGEILYRDGDIVYSIEASGGQPHRLSPRGAEVTTVQWSPDGRKVLQVVEDGGLWLSDPDGSGRERLARRGLHSLTPPVSQSVCQCR